MKAIISAFLVIFVLATAIHAGETIVLEYEFQEPVITKYAGYDVVNVEGTYLSGKVGSPALPVKGSMVLLPAGAVVEDVKVIPGELVELPGMYELLPKTRPVPLSMMKDHDMGPVRDENVYSSDEILPAGLFVRNKTEKLYGHRMAVFNLFPVRYVPAAGRISYYRSLRLEITTTFSEEVMDGTLSMLRNDPRSSSRVAAAVDNPGMIESYLGLIRDAKEPLMQLDDPSCDYVIITSADYESDFQALADFKNRRGMRTSIVLLADILASYPGVDDQDKIRNFLKDAYNAYGTSYVLFGGDDEMIPHRGLYDNAGGWESDEDIAADLYYAGLDRNGSGTGPDWNVDNDSRWGEPDEADLAAELFIGRATIDSHVEAQNFIMKQIMYQEMPVTGEVLEALMEGEDLGWSVWGKDYKEEVRLGSSNWGYTTVGFPARFHVETLYDRDGYWSKDQLINTLNAGVHLSNHLGHCSNDYCAKMYTSDVDRFTNNGVNHTFFIHYTQGCYCNAWDNRTPYGGYTSDAISERFVTVATAAVCFVGNTRYGWGNLYTTQGSSQYYDRQFFDAIFGEDLHHIGEVEEDSKIDNIPYIDLDANRYCHYELCLLGDPELSIWTNIPTDPDVIHPVVVPLGMSDFTITVMDGYDPVEGALVCAQHEGGFFESGYTDAFGSATLSLFVEAPDTVFVSAVAHNHYPYYGYSIPLLEGPYVCYLDHEVDDDMEGSSQGNCDGIVNPGETIELPIEVKNVGVETAVDVSGTLSLTDPYVTVPDDYEYFGTLDPGDSCFCEDDFDLQIAGDCPDKHKITLSLFLDSGTDTWESRFTLTASAARLSCGKLFCDDSGYGNGDGILDPGEVIEVYVRASNEGSATGAGIDGELTLPAPDQYITILQGTSSYPDMEPGAGDVNSTPYVIRSDPGTPESYFFDVRAAVAPDCGEGDQQDYSLTIGTFGDDMESGAEGWVHASDQGGEDMWHLETARNHTAGGSWSYKCGGAGTQKYEPWTVCCLQTPLVRIPAGAELRFWHWMDAEEYDETYAYDGGLLEISTDGSTWTQLTPEGNYTHVIGHRFLWDNPFPAWTHVWSGSFGWTRETVDLTAYEDRDVYFRFYFGSDEFALWGNLEGWYIDDVKIEVGGGGGDIVLTLTPDSVVLQPGETLHVETRLQNTGQESEWVKAYSEVFVKNGPPIPGDPVAGPFSLILGPGADMTRTMAHEIPPGAPTRTFTYRGTVEKQGGEVLDTDEFDFDIVE